MCGIIAQTKNAAGAGVIGGGNFFAIEARLGCRAFVMNAPRMRRAVAPSLGTRRNTPGILRDFPLLGTIDSARSFYFAMQQLSGLAER